MALMGRQMLRARMRELSVEGSCPASAPRLAYRKPSTDYSRALTLFFRSNSTSSRAQKTFSGEALAKGGAPLPLDSGKVRSSVTTPWWATPELARAERGEGPVLVDKQGSSSPRAAKR